MIAFSLRKLPPVSLGIIPGVRICYIFVKPLPFLTTSFRGTKKPPVKTGGAVCMIRNPVISSFS